ISAPSSARGASMAREGKPFGLVWAICRVWVPWVLASANEGARHRRFRLHATGQRGKPRHARAIPTFILASRPACQRRHLVVTEAIHVFPAAQVLGERG